MGHSEDGRGVVLNLIDTDETTYCARIRATELKRSGQEAERQRTWLLDVDERIYRPNQGECRASR